METTPYFGSPDEMMLQSCLRDDLLTFKYMVEIERCNINDEISCYCKPIGSGKLTLLKRTPLMLAAIFGSCEVFNYILQSGQVDVNKASSSDGATAITCAYSAGSSSQIIKRLIDANYRNASLIGSTSNKPNIIGQNSGEGCSKLAQGAEGLCSSVQPNSRDSFGEIIEHSDSDHTIQVSQPYDSKFLIFGYKVKFCENRYCENVERCLYRHIGEIPARRDLIKIFYSNSSCKHYEKGKCLRGDSCGYAHGSLESLYHPFMFRKKYCSNPSSCRLGNVCPLAHTEEELLS